MVKNAKNGVQGAPKDVQTARGLGPGVPVRGKEFLPETPGSRFAIGQSSSYKQPSSKQLKSRALKPRIPTSNALGVPEGTVRIY